MRCGTARKRILERRDAPLGPSIEAALGAHRARCSACDGFGRDLEQLGQLVSQLPLAEPSPNFEWRLKLRLSRLEREPEPAWIEARRRRWVGVLEFGSAAAAAAVLVVAVGLRVVQPPAAPAPGGTADLSLPVPADAGGQLTPVSYGPPIGPQPASYSVYFIQEPAAAVGVGDSATAPEPAAPAR